MSIKYKILILMISVSIIPLVFLGLVGYQKLAELEQTTRRPKIDTVQVLEITVDMKADEIERYFETYKNITTLLASDSAVKDAFGILRDRADMPNDPQRIAADRAVDAKFAPWLQPGLGVFNAGLIDDKGNIVYTAAPDKKPLYIKRNLDSVGVDMDEYRQKRTGVFVSSPYTSIGDNKRHVFVSAPIMASDGSFSGTLTVGLDLEPIQQLMGKHVTFGETGELAFSRKIDGEVRYFKELVPLKYVRTPEKISITGRENAPTVLAATGHNGSGNATDYAGYDVVAAWRYLPSLGWGLTLKIDREEAYSDLTVFARFIAVLFVVIGLLVTGMAFLLANSIARPLGELRHTADEISMGKLDTQLGAIDTDDEIGALARAFDRTIVSLKLAMRDVKKSSESEQQPIKQGEQQEEGTS